MTITVFTTSPIKSLRKSGLDAAKYLGEDIVFERVKPPKFVPTHKDREGITRIDWLWFAAYFRCDTLVAFHFTPTERRKWKLSPKIGGSSTKLKGAPYFYLTANPKRKAKGYPFSEVTRLLIHERCHAKTTRAVVHRADYDLKAIHVLAHSLNK
jgi:hypothetical protein